MYDILIKNGMIVDGSGHPMYRADIALKDDVIGAIGDLGHAQAERTIDAAGLYVAPGFIDVNNHSDVYWQLFNCPGLESLLFQGVTTIIGGNSGSSLAPLTHPNVIRSIQKWTDIDKITFDWLSLEEFLKTIQKKELSLNYGTLVGHGTLRRGVMKDETRAITPDEIARMQRLLKQALKEGAIGFSTGLRYTHARGTSKRELAILTKTAVEKDGVYATYIRDEEEGLLESIEEALAVAEETKASLHISHLKAVGKKNWHLMEEAINLIETAALNDIPVTFDVYPYTTTGSVLYTLLPEWITEGGRKMMLERLKESHIRESVLRDMRRKETDYSEILISVSTLSKMLTRRKISDIAFLHGKSPEETVLDVLIASAGRAIVSLEVLSEENVVKAVRHPFSIISSNGAGYKKEHRGTGELVHPRNFGTFPKVLAEYVREKKILSWEEAIHKMTGGPAKKFKLKKRGLLQENYFADIVIFHPDTIEDRATMEDPYQYSVGISHVLINGRLAVEEGGVTGKRVGVVLRSEHGFFPWS